MLTPDFLTSWDCPEPLYEPADAFHDLAVARFVGDVEAFYGALAVLEQVFDDPIGVVVGGAADDPGRLLDPEIRNFAAMVEVERNPVAYRNWAICPRPAGVPGA